MIDRPVADIGGLDHRPRLPTRQEATSSAAAAPLVDLISLYEVPEGPRVLRQALPVAHRIARVRQRCHAAGAPVIHANDNFGQWRSDFRQVVERCMQADGTGAEISPVLKPAEEDYFILKRMQSAFYQTPMQALLQELQVHRLVVTGTAGDACVLATASNANMRRFEVIVPEDCSVSPRLARNGRPCG